MIWGVKKNERIAIFLYRLNRDPPSKDIRKAVKQNVYTEIENNEGKVRQHFGTYKQAPINFPFYTNKQQQRQKAKQCIQVGLKTFSIYSSQNISPSFFLRLLLCIFSLYWKFATVLLLFDVSVFWWRDMWELSFSTRDGTNTPYTGRGSLNHWTAREVPIFCYLIYTQLCECHLVCT